MFIHTAGRAGLFTLLGALTLSACSLTEAGDGLPGTPTVDGKVRVLRSASLPATSLTALGYSDAQLASSKVNGLRSTDLPAIGSGLTVLPDGSFLGITDRGPNEDHLDAAGKVDGKTFPLPQFSPTLVRFQVDGARIVPTEYRPLRDGDGQGITGLTNVTGEELPFRSAAATTPLPFNVNGMDTEALARFPDGRLLVAEETSPSVAVLSAQGDVLIRYTPEGKTLDGAAYPVRPILPGVYLNRRVNRGFENLSLSADGKTAWVTLQSPMGDTKTPAYAASRVLRTLKLDVTDPLNARVTGEYLTLGSSISDYPASKKQADLKVSDTTWISGNKLLLLERASGLVRLYVEDFSAATDILNRTDESTLMLEAAPDLSALGVRASTRTLVFQSTDAGITDDKLEGVALVTPSVVALTNDNDFGIGDNTTGAPSRVWLVQLGTALR